MNEKRNEQGRMSTEAKPSNGFHESKKACHGCGCKHENKSNPKGSAK